MERYFNFLLNCKASFFSFIDYFCQFTFEVSSKNTVISTQLKEVELMRRD